jgi:chromosome segregation ATPase
MAKRLTEDQIQRWVMMRIEYCADSGIGVAPHSSLAQDILAELEATEEQPEDVEVDLTSVEARAEMFFDEITARFPPEWGKDPRQLMRERYRYLSRRSIQLENEAVRDAVRELTEERDMVKGKRDELVKMLEEVRAKADELEAERDELKDVIDQVRSVRDDLKAKVEAVTKERDELEADRNNFRYEANSLLDKSNKLQSKLLSMRVKAEEMLK